MLVQVGRATAGHSMVPDCSNNLCAAACRSIHRGAYFAELRTTTVRKLLPESWGFLCPVHTPDGSPCGLLNHFSAACSVITEGPAEPQAREVGLTQVSNLSASGSFLGGWAGLPGQMSLRLPCGVLTVEFQAKAANVLAWNCYVVAAKGSCQCVRVVCLLVCVVAVWWVWLGDDSSYCLRGHLLSTTS
jgi:hypothetical protein